MFFGYKRWCNFPKVMLSGCHGSHTTMTTIYNTIELQSGTEVFYREAGQANKETLLLLHGYPSSSFQYRNLITLLSPKYRLIAPDLPGFGFTKEKVGYVHTFANIAATIDEFVEELGLKKFALYIFDYGAPTGLRLALKDPSRVTAIISQNGNAYVEGLDDQFWKPLREFWATNDKSHEGFNKALLQFVQDKQNVDDQYYKNENTAVDPAAPFLDYQLLLTRPAQVQVDLFYDYKENVSLYPKFQEYFRVSNVPILIVWGEKDYIFAKEGAEAFKRDSKNVQYHYVDAGHFALENKVEEIAGAIEEFLQSISSI